MNIKVATKVAICGVSVGLILAALYPAFSQWVEHHYFQERVNFDTGKMLVNGYNLIRSIFEDGGILLFLITVLQRQKGD